MTATKFYQNSKHFELPWSILNWSITLKFNLLQFEWIGKISIETKLIFLAGWNHVGVCFEVVLFVCLFLVEGLNFSFWNKPQLTSWRTSQFFKNFCYCFILQFACTLCGHELSLFLSLLCFLQGFDMSLIFCMSTVLLGQHGFFFTASRLTTMTKLAVSWLCSAVKHYKRIPSWTGPIISSEVTQRGRGKL